ncbi:FlgB family protein [Paracoccus tegillarcae]|uniref:Flagellar basal body rod protein FlgB n=1 Tax=Paracoccus tegillarcae TaxID=1529068 RepID=A0A2K9EF92_9RHOB|nr:FlgB family protein [Paracoccus tegillarcae]AUH33618.1 flagellar basal body rod protein FlgB [Paracoccus tegillarcae]
MFERIELVQMARAMTDHAAQRQKVVARNIANADTPGFAARDVTPFGESYRGGQGDNGLRGTNPRHLTTPFWSSGTARVTVDDAQPSPNGNSVSIEAEMIKTAELRGQHELSVGIYRSALDIMRTSIGRRA